MQTEPPAPDLPAAPSRARALDDNPALAGRAADCLRLPYAAVQMSADEARYIVAQMRLVTVPKGAALFRAGDERNLNHLLLVLEGDVSVDAGASGAPDAVAISVLGPGSVIGEMSLVDGAPRSASCTALSAVTAAGLPRQGLERLVAEHPQAACKLLMVLAHCTADRLRALGEQLKMYAQLNGALRQQLEVLRRAASQPG